MPSNISIIVPPSGGAAQALRCFEGIAAQPDDPAHEIIVVDDRRLGFALAVLSGAERASGEILVFVRDAAVPAHGWLGPTRRGARRPRRRPRRQRDRRRCDR
jgi:hypothetical protein